MEHLDKLEREASVYYFLWFSVYVLLGLSAILLPALAAMGFNFGFVDGQKYLAGFGSIASAVFVFVRPADYASAFDAAFAECRSLRIRFEKLTDEEKGERFDRILRLMAFKYRGDLPSNPKASPKDP